MHATEDDDCKITTDLSYMEVNGRTNQDQGEIRRKKEGRGEDN